jgi:hypothetical protein
MFRFLIKLPFSVVLRSEVGLRCKGFSLKDSGSFQFFTISLEMVGFYFGYVVDNLMLFGLPVITLATQPVPHLLPSAIKVGSAVIKKCHVDKTYQVYSLVNPSKYATMLVISPMIGFFFGAALDILLHPATRQVPSAYIPPNLFVSIEAEILAGIKLRQKIVLLSDVGAVIRVNAFAHVYHRDIFVTPIMVGFSFSQILNAVTGVVPIDGVPITSALTKR